MKRIIYILLLLASFPVLYGAAMDISEDLVISNDKDFLKAINKRDLVALRQANQSDDKKIQTYLRSYGIPNTQKHKARALKVLETCYAAGIDLNFPVFTLYHVLANLRHLPPPVILDILNFLIEHGVDLNKTYNDVNLSTPLHVLAAYLPQMNNKVEEMKAKKPAIKELLKDYLVNDVIGIINSFAIVKQKINKKLFNVSDDVGTPLYHAVDASNVDAVKFLLDCGADPQTASESGKSLTTFAGQRFRGVLPNSPYYNPRKQILNMLKAFNQKQKNTNKKIKKN